MTAPVWFQQDVLVPTDPIVVPTLQAMLRALGQELARTAKGVPKHLRVTPGDAVFASLTNTVNECCEGIGSVRMARYFPCDQLPVESQRPETEGGIVSWAIEMELQVVRCSNTPGPGMAPSDSAITQDALAEADDQAAMRRAVKSLYNAGAILDYVINIGQPTAAEGGCVGGTLNVHVQIACEESTSAG